MKKQKLFQLIALNLKKYGAKKVAIFGSYARNEEKKTSDIDILVKFSPAKSLLDLVKIERELSETAGVKVDLLTEKAISPLLINNIKKEMKVLLP
ncbi:MAG TPA: hypothetical protein DEQ77_00925 [Candidatus Omnitrophica bacterium]|nr:hypothetical protein [Candidatus Omnitrophota bacterium]